MSAVIEHMIRKAQMLYRTMSETELLVSLTSPYFALPSLPAPTLLLVTASPHVMITSPCSVCCVHLELKLITSDNLLVLFPQFKSFSAGRVMY